MLFCLGIAFVATSILRIIVDGIGWYIVTAVLGVSAWIIGAKSFDRDRSDTLANWGRIIGIVCTVTILFFFAILIRARLIAVGILS